MSSNENTDEQILGIDVDDSSSKNASLDCSKVDDDSCLDLDDDLLLQDSPPPSSKQLSTQSSSRTSLHPPPHVKQSKTEKTSVTSVVSKMPPKSADALGLARDTSDDDLEIIEDADVEEIDDSINDDCESESASESDEMEQETEDEEEIDEIFSGDSEEGNLEPDTALDGKINIFHCRGAFLVWNAEDAQMLREECRIVGKLTGSLPRAPRQNSHLGLPLQLMPEEVKVLVDIDAVVVVEEEPVPDHLLVKREAACQNVRSANFKIQQKLFKEGRREEVEQRMKDIIAGKKAKKARGKKATQVGQDTAETALSQDKHADNSTLGEEERDKEGEDMKTLTVDDIVAETADTSETHCMVQLFTENPWKKSFRPWLGWQYPSTDREILRYQVFKDLWNKGFFLTSGAKFGGDFLVYPGDPARFHSHYIAICRGQTEDMPCLDLITCGRQATSVRKSALICSLDRAKQVFYTTLQWTGLS